MKSRQESTSPKRWSELLLGGTLAGVGAPLLIKGAHRWLHLGPGTSPASVGWTAGLLGALVAGRLARRRPSRVAPEPREESPLVLLAPEAIGEAEPLSRVPEAQEAGDGGADEAGVDDWQREVRRWRAVLARHSEVPADGDASSREVERRLRRGPSGREQPWHEALEATPA